MSSMHDRQPEPADREGAWAEPRSTAVLALADGTLFEGFGFGASGHAVGEVCFVQFRTMDMPQYGGYSNYQVFCIFREHLRAPAERPPDAKRLGPGVQKEPAVLPNVSHHQEKGQREFSALPRVAAPLPERVRVENAQIPQNQCPQRSAGCACSKRKRRGCSSRVNFLFGDVFAKSQLKRPPWHPQDLPLVSRGVV